jgi:hypothetical protein
MPGRAYRQAVSRNRSKFIVAFCWVTFALFLGQTFACFAEQANIIPCIHECEHAHDSTPVSETTGECDTTACHSSFVTISHDFLAPITPINEDLCTADESTPDGPFREIDYPPQLS